MRFPSLTLAFAIISTAQGASPTTSTLPSTTIEPCAIVGSLIASSTNNRIPAQAAYNCLTSVPVNVEGNSKLIDELKLLWQWQSEVGWLKNPPSTWELGPIDLIGELDKIKAKLPNYTNEYQVHVDIQRLTIRTGNFHFNYQPDILQIFLFLRQIAIVSISDDGKNLPKIYTASDIILQNSQPTNISSIVKINGEDVQSYLAKIAAGNQYIDPDARLNNLFWRANETASLGSFYIQTGYDGPSTNITFTNGTTKSYDNLAIANQDFTGIDSGAAFFQTFCTGAISGFNTTTAAATSSTPTSSAVTGTPRPKLTRRDNIASPHLLQKRQTIPNTYPTPIVEHSGGAVAGYFMNTPGFQDIAVLKIISFEPQGDDSGVEFQSVIEQFLGNATSANMKKLIVDLRENGGGATNLLLDTFMQLFPSMTPFSGQRYRAQEQFRLIGDSVSKIFTNESLSSAYDTYTNSDIGSDYRYWAYWHFVDANNNNWPSWDAFYGPHFYNDDNFTTTMRYNLSNSDRVSIVVPGFNFVTGSRPQPFSADNMVMFTDGLCGSSCASFHEEMKNIAGVKSVVVGGRPKVAPMQAIGGTKGGEVVPLNNFPTYATQLINATDAIGANSLHDTAIETLSEVTQVMVRAGDSSSRLQTQDQIRKGGDSETPLQYIYEAADCRIWLTSKMLFDPNEAWKSAWTAFSDMSTCVNGSTGDKSSISGGYKPFGPGPLHGNMNQTTPNGTVTSSTPTPSSTVLTVPTSGAIAWVPSSVLMILAMLPVLAML
ncbi:hypothetical protein AOQ84DRAFT_388421 [Glonium stellatum]|uniref:Tail specific protease domain-containing protein n=1 Tax=Glonium stellatum TaxID=574774 RepID=A0A8E2F1V6_9PEZI|nr:hypothetical protein AOQ84DRAFT_388421 [Glonium stellatum]